MTDLQAIIGIVTIVFGFAIAVVLIKWNFDTLADETF